MATALKVHSLPNEEESCISCNNVLRLSTATMQLTCGHLICQICFTREIKTTNKCCPGKKEKCSVLESLLNGVPYNIIEDGNGSERMVRCESCGLQLSVSKLKEHLVSHCANHELSETDLDNIMDKIENTLKLTSEKLDSLIILSRKSSNEMEVIVQKAKERESRISKLEAGTVEQNGVALLSERINECNVAVNNQDSVFNQLEHNIQMLESTSFDGKLIWKIKTSELKPPFIESMPFYTSRNGYRMLVRIYAKNPQPCNIEINIGHMKSDGVPYPFRQRVLLQLINQESGPPIEKLFEPHSQDAQEPVDNETVHVISSQAATLHVEGPKLQLESAYNKNGVIYIRAVVNTNIAIPNLDGAVSSGPYDFPYADLTEQPSTSMHFGK